MKILVEMKDGEKRVITLVPPMTAIHDGEYLDPLEIADAMRKDQQDAGRTRTEREG